ncbi:hypothetical protein XU18_3759, partial [Perkinsela sp. CCAP 1560/4]
HPAAQVARKPPRPTSLLRAITEQELHDALRFTKCHRACGPDDVYNEALLQLPKLARTALLRTFNRSLSRGIVPRAWKSGTIVPFLKPGKPAGRVDSYRPVTLTSAIAKLMERILHEHQRGHLSIQIYHWGRLPHMFSGLFSPNIKISINVCCKSIDQSNPPIPSSEHAMKTDAHILDTLSK